jgi:hypothetical protein
VIFLIGIHEEGIVSIIKLNVPTQDAFLNELVFPIQVIKERFVEGSLLLKGLIVVAFELLVHTDQVLRNLKIEIAQFGDLLADLSYLLPLVILVFIHQHLL